MTPFYWNKEDLVAKLCQAIHDQTEIDNVGDGKTILFCQEEPTLKPKDLLENFFHRLGMEIEEPS